MLDDRPDEFIIDGRVLVSQLIAKVDDAPRLSDRVKSLRGDAGQYRDGLPDDDELPLDRGAYQAIRFAGRSRPATAARIASQDSMISER